MEMSLLKKIKSRLYPRVILLSAVLTFSGTFMNPKAAVPVSDQIHTGPEVGQTIPPFDAPDQNGRRQTFETVRGPRGALIVFYRSADW